MRNVKVLGKSIVDVYDNMFALLLINVVWALLAALPGTAIIGLLTQTTADPETMSAAPVILFLASVVLVLLSAPPAYAMAVLQRRVVEFESISFGDFLQAMRQNLRRAWLMGGISIGGTWLLAINLVFYVTVGGWGPALAPFFFLMALLWILIQLFFLPMAVITDGGPLRVMRNSAIIVFRHPMLSLVCGIAALFFIILSTVLVIPWLILTMALLTALGTRAVRSAVRRDFGLPEEDPLSMEPLPPIAAADDDPHGSLPYYGWRPRRETSDEATETTAASTEAETATVTPHSAASDSAAAATEPRRDSPEDDRPARS